MNKFWLPKQAHDLSFLYWQSHPVKQVYCSIVPPPGPELLHYPNILLKTIQIQFPEEASTGLGVGVIP